MSDTKLQIFLMNGNVQTITKTVEFISYSKLADFIIIHFNEAKSTGQWVRKSNVRKYIHKNQLSFNPKYKYENAKLNITYIDNTVDTIDIKAFSAVYREDAIFAFDGKATHVFNMDKIEQFELLEVVK